MKILKYIVYLCLSVLAIFMIAHYLQLDNIKIFDTISTFLSITIGFTITALSIIATSPFSRRLYNIESDRDNSRSLLHVLIGNFKQSTLIFIITIGLIIILYLYPEEYDGIDFQISKIDFNNLKVLKSTIIYFTGLSFYKFISLFFTFSRFVIKSSVE